MKLATTRRITPSVLLTAALLALSPAAIAVPPEKGDPVPDLGPFDLPAGEACEDFPLRIEGTDSNATVRIFKDKKGEVVRILQTGRGYTLTYTNLLTLESVTIRPTGSNRRIVENADGTFTVTDTGTAGIILFPGDTPEGPSSTQYYGRLVYTLAADGSTFESLDTTGTSRDICAELA
ncbi:hypothetical protein [Arthrobacter sp. P2b]|uniref:hypothetical protein n=1 Tax=Arthrobacter sp. P2b TaxID=1938741 RepID=UPI0009CBAA9C|nr:hypothetical protein [Arthrobacter sp. P2b]SLK00889.1 hypothetical protein SAMN06272721_103190 [Arthrobacter sp. P2b]